MRLSAFGEKFTAHAGVVDLMDDLGEALRADPAPVFMGGGNPARVPAVEAHCRELLGRLIADPDSWQRLVGSYQSPQGDPAFRERLARYLAERYGWALGPDNIAIANGSQSAYFVLYNLFAGRSTDGARRRIHLPLVPEYIGYADAGLEPAFFSATAPQIEDLPGHEFKYRVDLAALEIGEDIGALALSRPTNPTGNVLSRRELDALAERARDADIPLIVDGAYGDPFPAITYGEASPTWDEQTILTLSLSKLGLPGLRTGIVIASETLARAFARANTVIQLAPGNLGPAVAEQLLVSGAMDRLCEAQLRTYYRRRLEDVLDALHDELAGLPWRFHRPGGAFFLWLWLPGLPVSSAELYRRLKARGLIAIPGEHFFIGVDSAWRHTRECLRLSYAQEPALLRRGIGLLGEELRALYGASGP